VDSDYLRIRDVLGRLSEQPIDLTILSRTMVGRVVSKLKRCPNASIAAEAKTILKKWRKIAEEENRRIAEKQTARTRAPRGARTEDPAATGKKIGKQSSLTQTTCVNVKVAHIRPRYKNLAEWTADTSKNVYIGRRGVVFVDGKRFPPADSVWCNPFKIKGSMNRQQVIKEYEKNMRAKVAEDESLKQRMVRELEGKCLGCWCKPEGCHGDVLIKMVKEFSAELSAGECSNHMVHRHVDESKAVGASLM